MTKQSDYLKNRKIQYYNYRAQLKKQGFAHWLKNETFADWLKDIEISEKIERR